MTFNENQAILTVSLMAAFADGAKHDRERHEIKRIADGLGQADGIHLPTLYQDVLMNRVSLDTALPALTSAQSRQLAYEMAVCVCDADGVQSSAEQAFLRQLATALGLNGSMAQAFSEQAEALASSPWQASAGLTAATAAGALAAPLATDPASANASPARASTASDSELDKTILNAAILNGALELLPETLSTMAIIPLQMKLVYRIGQAHGYELDRGHVKDFLATAGVGLTSQYLEQAGRKLLGGLLGRVGGGLLGGVGRQAVSTGMSFASTYALGHVAKRYYAGGRTLSAQMLKDTYAGLTNEGQGLQAQYGPAIQNQAKSLDISKVLAMVRG